MAEKDGGSRLEMRAPTMVALPGSEPALGQSSSNFHNAFKQTLPVQMHRSMRFTMRNNNNNSVQRENNIVCQALSSTDSGDLRIVTQGRHLKLTDALRDIAEEKAAKVLGRYSSAIKEVDINLSVSKGKGEEKQKCELTVFLKRLGVVRAEETAENMYAAIEEVSDVVARKMRKVKEKAIASGKWEGTAGPRGHSFTKELPEEYFSDDEELDLNAPAPPLPPEILRTKTISLEPMSVQEALYQADQLGHAFYIFKDEESNVKVLYKRRHRGYGLLEPE